MEHQAVETGHIGVHVDDIADRVKRVEADADRENDLHHRQADGDAKIGERTGHAFDRKKSYYLKKPRTARSMLMLAASMAVRRRRVARASIWPVANAFTVRKGRHRRRSGRLQHQLYRRLRCRRPCAGDVDPQAARRKAGDCRHHPAGHAAEIARHDRRDERTADHLRGEP